MFAVAIPATLVMALDGAGNAVLVHDYHMATLRSTTATDPDGDGSLASSPLRF